MGGVVARGDTAATAATKGGGQAIGRADAGPLAWCRAVGAQIGSPTKSWEIVGYERQVAIALGDIEPVADDELVGDREPHVFEVERIEVAGGPHE